MDYTNSSGSITFIPGVSDICVEVPINNDDLVELSENFTMTFTSNVPGVLSSISTVTILDNDQIGKHSLTVYSLATILCKEIFLSGPPPS